MSKTASFFRALEQAGMPPIPAAFSVVPQHQVIASSILADIDAFIQVFDRVTARPAWQRTVTADAPQLARQPRVQTCFFSAWDFHLPPDQPEQWQLIEFNDNGSGLLFAALINRIYYEHFNLDQDAALIAPPLFSALQQEISAMLVNEAHMAGLPPHAGLWLILEDAEALQHGKFRQELHLLRELLKSNGWAAAIGSPDELDWTGQRLDWQGQSVYFVINRCTDFYWQAERFTALRAAYGDGQIYISPNPFSYATRSDKRLLAWLSSSKRDTELGIQPDERLLLNAHVPETQILSECNVDRLAARKDTFVFKPMHGFAAHGVLPHNQVGHSRLKRLLRKGQSYVAQQRVAKPGMDTEEGRVWNDLRVWAYKGRCFMLSGRASGDPERMQLQPPGGWLPTFAVQR